MHEQRRHKAENRRRWWRRQFTRYVTDDDDAVRRVQRERVCERSCDDNLKIFARILKASIANVYEPQSAPMEKQFA